MPFVYFFADDTMIGGIDKSLKEVSLQQLQQKAANEAIDWFRHNKLILNIDK